MADKMNKEREAVARAIWALMREHEDRCDQELEDLEPSHPIWSYADAARASIAASAGSEPVAWGIFDSEGFYEVALDEGSGQRFVDHYNKRRDGPLKPFSLRALYTHPSPTEGAGWRPIETAPRDGTPIWLYTLAGQCEGYWNYGEWVQDAVYCTYDGAGGPAFECNPTHWMPLPKAPAPPASEAKGA